MPRFNLERLAFQVMQERGLEPQFPVQVSEQLEAINAPAAFPPHCQDLRHLLFCSIDNDDSLDLDQLTVAQKESDGKTSLWIAVADVSALVPKDSPIDAHAQINTTSVYTPAKVFPMLPEKLSTHLTSLGEGEDRLALVVKAVVNKEGEVIQGDVFRAVVQNKAKLAYPSLGDWLEGKGKAPEKVSRVKGLEQALLCQDETAQLLKQWRHRLGALTLQSPQVEARIKGDDEVVLRPFAHNRAEELIEHFMIAANFVMASQLKDNKIPSLRRIVRIPKRWDRIVQVAYLLGESLPKEPDAKALENFLVKRRKADPEAFPDLSLTIIKLLGRGEYVVASGQLPSEGHFGLALSEYTHSTAPNRRFPDLIAQRQYKAFLEGKQLPYSLGELQILATHCTQQEDAATKVERHLNKSAAAVLLSSQIGERFQGIVTGATEAGTWARIFNPPVEGKILHGAQGLDVGDRVHLKLVSVDISKGYINFTTS
jgi:VacB/RNase II family 3'-5' exoribonuclease